MEITGRGRGVKYILSRKFYTYIGQKGTYTRKKGLERETNKELLLKHIRDNRNAGSKLNELMQVLPNLSYSQVRTLLREMKKQGKIMVQGKTNSGRWFPVVELENQFFLIDHNLIRNKRNVS